MTVEDEDKLKQIAKGRDSIYEMHIIKVMKARKKEKLTNLIQDVMNNIHMFKAEVKIVKERIEELIIKGYIERDTKDKTILIYIP